MRLRMGTPCFSPGLDNCPATLEGGLPATAKISVMRITKCRICGEPSDVQRLKKDLCRNFSWLCRNWDIRLHLQHRRTASFRDAAACVELARPVRTPWPSGANSQSYQQRLVQNARQAPSH